MTKQEAEQLNENLCYRFKVKNLGKIKYVYGFPAGITEFGSNSFYAGEPSLRIENWRKRYGRWERANHNSIVVLSGILSASPITDPVKGFGLY